MVILILRKGEKMNQGIPITPDLECFLSMKDKNTNKEHKKMIESPEQFPKECNKFVENIEEEIPIIYEEEQTKEQLELEGMKIIVDDLLSIQQRLIKKSWRINDQHYFEIAMKINDILKNLISDEKTENESK